MGVGFVFPILIFILEYVLNKGDIIFRRFLRLDWLFAVSYSFNQLIKIWMETVKDTIKN